MPKKLKITISTWRVTLKRTKKSYLQGHRVKTLGIAHQNPDMVGNAHPKCSRDGDLSRLYFPNWHHQPDNYVKNHAARLLY